MAEERLAPGYEQLQRALSACQEELARVRTALEAERSSLAADARVEAAEAARDELARALENEWERNHADTCTNMKDCETFGGATRCSWPRPDALSSEATKGKA